jgi:hypothetical protein
MPVYAKLWSDILDSSVWSADSDTRIIWITLLAMADQDGYVKAAAPAIAHRARIVTDVTVRALDFFQQPDPDSRTTKHEGRRLEKVPGGYLILNYVDYRNKKTAAEERAINRERVRAWREKQKDKPSDVTVDVTNVTNVTKSNAIQKHIQSTEAEAEKKSTAQSDADAAPAPIPQELENLELYRVDKRLCKAWLSFYEAAKTGYPNVDVLAELRVAHAWEVANPSRRKKDRVRFLNNWFLKAQDSPRPQGIGAPPSPARDAPKPGKSVEQRDRERLEGDIPEGPGPWYDIRGRLVDRYGKRIPGGTALEQ